MKTKLTEKQKVFRRRLLKLSRFIRKLPRRKLNMEEIAWLNGAEKMNPIHCTSVACVMGWTPIVFPRLVKYLPGDYNANKYLDHYTGQRLSEYLSVGLIGSGRTVNYQAMRKIFGLSYHQAEVLFSSGGKGYSTPKQVADGIEAFVRSGQLPSINLDITAANSCDFSHDPETCDGCNI